MQVKNTFYILLYLFFATFNSANGSCFAWENEDAGCCNVEKTCCLADANCCFDEDDSQEPVEAHWLSLNTQVHFFSKNNADNFILKLAFSGDQNFMIRSGNDPPPDEKVFLKFHQLIFYA